MLCCQKVLLAPLMGTRLHAQHPGRWGTCAERNQRGENEYILLEQEGETGGVRKGGGGQYELEEGLSLQP